MSGLCSSVPPVGISRIRIEFGRCSVDIDRVLILGIDPGTIKVGFGLVKVAASSYRAVAYGVIKCKPTDPPAVRLGEVFSVLQQVIEEHRPEVVALEDGFAGKNPRSALRIGEGRGAAMAAAAVAGLHVEVYAPSAVKRSVTGTGRAGKASVAQMVALVLGLPTPPASDAADALAVALCHGQRAAMLAATNELRRATG
ncbi:MAG: crossover junction endodeoxyribonuclease RuvC [Planctomycetota bacterium]